MIKIPIRKDIVLKTLSSAPLKQSMPNQLDILNGFLKELRKTNLGRVTVVTNGYNQITKIYSSDSTYTLTHVLNVIYGDNSNDWTTKQKATGNS